MLRKSGDVYHFANEPGDATRYEFSMTKIGSTYFIMPYNNAIKYPYRIDQHQVMPSVSDRDFAGDLYSLAYRLECNPNTLNQVMLAIETYEKEVGCRPSQVSRNEFWDHILAFDDDVLIDWDGKRNVYKRKSSGALVGKIEKDGKGNNTFYIYK